MTGDPAAAPGAGSGSLDDLQAWFGRAISRPLPKEYSGNPLAGSAPELAADGNALIHGRGGVSGFDRAGIYNQQYWFRLITIMQEEYACAVHVLGLKAYNDWAIRYLAAHPPASPYLSRLDAEWLDFMAREYRPSGSGGDPDREAVLQALAYDRAFSRAFDAPDGLPMPGEVASPHPGDASPQSAAVAASGAVRAASDPADLAHPATPDHPATPPAPADMPLLAVCLSPHATVVRLTYDFPAFRPLCLTDASLEQAIPLHPGGSPMVIWRGRDLALWQKPVSEAACKVLEALAAPAALPEAFARLEGALSPEEEEELVANITEWFAEWTREGILCRA